MASPNVTMSALGSLSDAEKHRLIVAFLHHKDRANVDWDAAATFTGSKSANSFRTNVGKVIKKLTDASEDGTSEKRKRNDGDGDAEEAGGKGTNTGRPQKRVTKKARGKKQAANEEDHEPEEV
ncbi:hypothetical protein SLS58_004866 [Diplodia intermedia]|uniref:Uncharacterized protein n=1 Tax=Diplodia intermedia TaxID=856260 RepID=A0ABR3TSN5_9PEZI